jgi:DNA-binding XRE family transcriptional regulator
LAQDGLSAIFGIDLEDAPPVPQPVKHAKKAASGKTATQAGKKTPARKFGENSNDKSGWLDGGKSKPVAKRAAKPAPRPKPAPIFNPDAPTGPAIARLRAQAGLSASQFAKALGVSEQSVQRWEAASGPLRIRARPLAALDKLQNKLASGRRRPA